LVSSFSFGSSTSSSTSHLQIPLPHDLFQKGGYAHTSASFGTIPYGGSIVRQLYYYAPSTDFCNDNNPDYEANVWPKVNDENKMDFDYGFLVMMDYNHTIEDDENNSDCTIALQVHKAQKSGALGVIFRNTKCLCDDKDCVETLDDQKDCLSSTPSLISKATVADDITIPTFLLTKKLEGDAIHKVLTNEDDENANTVVELQMSWDLPNPNDRIRYDLWTTPTPHTHITTQSSSQTFDFETHLWSDVLNPFTKRIVFTPHQYLYDGSKIGCFRGVGVKEDTVCEELCTNNGRYCSMQAIPYGEDDDEVDENAVNGHDVVVESLRRMCVWTHYTNYDEDKDSTLDDHDVENTHKYWDYVKGFAEKCDNPSHHDDKNKKKKKKKDQEKLPTYKDPECYEKVMKDAKIDPKVISDCMSDSGNTEHDVDNRFLKESIEKSKEKGVVVVPTLLLNDNPFRGPGRNGVLSLINVVDSICAEFTEVEERVEEDEEEKKGDESTSSPVKELQICQTCSESQCSNLPKDRLECVRTGVCPTSSGTTKMISRRFFGVTLLLLFLLFVIGAVMYYRKNRDDMRNKVLHILAEYMPLDGGDDNDGNGGGNIGGGARGRIGQMMSGGGGRIAEMLRGGGGGGNAADDGGESGTASLLADDTNIE